MKNPTLTAVKKYRTAINKYKGKYVTSEMLSRVIGIYPEVINDHLSYFDPIIAMDYKYDLKKVLPLLDKFVEQKESEEKRAHPETIEYATKKKVDGYYDIQDFVYQKMTLPSGIVDKNAVLTDIDLKILKKLVAEEQAKRKGRK